MKDKEQIHKLFWNLSTIDIVLKSLLSIVKYSTNDQLIKNDIKHILSNKPIIAELEEVIIKCGKKSVVQLAYKLAIEMQMRRSGRKIFSENLLARMFQDSIELYNKLASKIMFHQEGGIQKNMIMEIVKLFLQKNVSFCIFFILF